MITNNELGLPAMPATSMLIGWPAMSFPRMEERTTAFYTNDDERGMMDLWYSNRDNKHVYFGDLTPWGIHGKIIETPGHSESCTSVVLDSGAAFTGDLVVTEPDSQRSTIAMFAYRENNDEEVRQSVRKLLPLAETWYSGHGGPFTRAEVQAMLDEEST